MEQVGVELVVKGVSEFIKDMAKANGSVDKFQKGVEGLGKGAAANTGFLGKFGSALRGIGQALVFLAQPLAIVTGGTSEIIAMFGLLMIAGGEVMKFVGRFVDGLINLAVSVIKGSVIGAFNALVAVIGAVGGVIGKLIGIILGPFISAWNSLVGIVKQALGVFGGLSLYNAIQSITDALKNQVTEVFKAAAGWQQLEISLQTLIASHLMQNATTDTLEFADALGMAAGQVKDLEKFLATAGVLTPFSTQDVADVFRLATSYNIFKGDVVSGYAETKLLTQSIVDFAAAMGLTDVQMKRVIENFGQMVQQGKITGMELRDLARGAFVPVNDVLEETARLLDEDVADALGVTIEQLNALRKAGATEFKGMNLVDTFIRAFEKLVAKNFTGAAARAVRTWKGITEALHDLRDSVVGLFIIKPILDTVSNALADFLFGPIEAKGKGGIFGTSLDLDKYIGGLERVKSSSQGIFDIADRIGQAFATIAENVLTAFGVDVQAAAEGFLEKFNDLALIIEALAAGDLQFVIDTLAIPDWVVETVSNLVQGFQNILTFWTRHGGEIKRAILDALGTIWDAIFGADGKNPFESLSEGFLEFTKTLKVQPIVDQINKIRDAIIGVIGFLTGKQVVRKLQKGTEPGEEPRLGPPTLEENKDGQLSGLPKIIDDLVTGFEEWRAKAESVWWWIDKIVSLLLSAVELVGKIVGFLLNPVGGITDAIAGAFGGDSGLGGVGTRIGEEIVSGLQGALVAGKGGVQADAKELAGAVSTGLSDGKPAIKTKSDEIVTIFTTAAGNIVSSFKKIGAEAIGGLILGFVTSWLQKKDALKKVIDEIVSFIKKLLGIKSPSKVFAQIGRQMMQGMTVGLRQGIPLVESALSSIPLPANSPFSGGASTTNVVNYNVNMTNNNQFANAQSPQDDLAAVVAILKSS